MTRSSYYIFVMALTGFLSAVAGAATASDRTVALDKRHKACLEQIAIDQEYALEDAMIWRDQGGGRRARHCEAMALFALGHEDEAAHRLDLLAGGADGGSDDMRRNFRSEAANFWLAAGNARKAYESATAGLKLDPDHVDLRVARARAYTITGQYKFAETDLSTVLKDAPYHAEALRYRADARFRQQRYEAALNDIEASLNADPTSVDTALLRGHIREAIRIEEAAAADGDE
ncbi:tetratricopeptide repeat protein [Algimonas porphyrae]|uniref:Tetratricopeptide repeat protein n=1 Tax=Algimonas porphyrae TaxID=1128113 RepID=A0ABQ5UWU0_9PROT|nr:hypothetical protein [Algimonas porphyrae]GLQ19770.1 hypothetical protein GCM10007854_07250 [Algimonas porphyrae]